MVTGTQDDLRVVHKSLVKIFLTEPFPLPIWIWNLLVIGIYLSIGLFAIQIVIILVFGILSLFF